MHLRNSEILNSLTLSCVYLLSNVIFPIPKSCKLVIFGQVYIFIKCFGLGNVSCPHLCLEDCFNVYMEIKEYWALLPAFDF